MSFATFFIFSVTILCCHARFCNYDYCQLTCNNGHQTLPHLICKREGDCSASNCPGYEEVVMTNQIKQLITDEHNKYRNLVATGQEIRGQPGPQPPAANMRALKYNDELAHVAQCWANTCEFKHSDCRTTSRFPHVGENLAIRKSTAMFLDIPQQIRKMISAWYEEVNLFHPHYIQSYKHHSSTGHYTLMVWADIEEIGCGIVKYQSDKWHVIQMTCHYGTTGIPGNLIGGVIYEVGPPLSNCPPYTGITKKYAGLCGSDTLNLRNALAPRYFPRPNWTWQRPGVFFKI